MKFLLYLKRPNIVSIITNFDVDWGRFFPLSLELFFWSEFDDEKRLQRDTNR